MARKVKNFETVGEWVTELHRLAQMTGTFNLHENIKMGKALARAQADFGAWIKDHPDVPISPFLANQKWAKQ